MRLGPDQREAAGWAHESAPAVIAEVRSINSTVRLVRVRFADRQLAELLHDRWDTDSGTRLGFVRGYRTLYGSAFESARVK